MWLTLFQVKLFREWSAKWPEDHKMKLKEKVCEIDATFGEKLNKEILNGYSNGDDVAAAEPADQPAIAIQNEAIVAWAHQQLQVCNIRREREGKKMQFADRKRNTWTSKQSTKVFVYLIWKLSWIIARSMTV